MKKIKVERGDGYTKSDLKGCIEALICSVEEQTLRANYIKFNIDKTSALPLCRMCSNKSETFLYIVSECSVLAQEEYKRRHANVARYINWRLCEKYKLHNTDKWYEHRPDGVSENDNCKILWDVMIQCDKEIATINNTLTDNQAAYRNLFSTMKSLITSIDYWYENIDCRKINLYNSGPNKGLNTVDHAILIQKPQKYGIKDIEGE